MEKGRAPEGLEGKIVKEGYPFIASSLILTLLLWVMMGIWAGIPFLLVTVWICWFFRNPERTIPQGQGEVVSPADGKVVQVKRIVEKQFLHRECLRVSVFMSVFNVHVNRSPIQGVVRKIAYCPGRFLVALCDKASEENEKNSILVEDHKGRCLVVEQIAGIIARRIVCRVSEGQAVEKGARFGMIRFGSRLDTYLPLDVELKIGVGSRVWGGETVLGVLP